MSVEVSPNISGRLWPGRKLGDYVVQKRLSQGGYGAVYRATNTKLEGRDVVIKVMHATDQNSRDLLRKEARQLVSLRHPSLVQVITYGEEGELQYVVMEFLDAPTLSKVHKDTGTFGLFEVVRLGARIAEALEAVHDVGLVHRDLKPDNIMLKLSKDRGRYVDWLKLIDFGLAHQTGRGGAERAGTAPYVAPETIDPSMGGVAPATDLYSLGCILFELLTNQTPYVGDTDSMIEGHVRGPIRRLSSVIRDVHPEMDDLVFELIQKKPADRPASATEVVKTLAKIEQSLVGGETNIFRLSQSFSDTKPLPPRDEQTHAEPPQRLSQAATDASVTLSQDKTSLAVPVLRDDDSGKTLHTIQELPNQRKSRMGLWVGLAGAGLLVAFGIFQLTKQPADPVAVPVPAVVPIQPEALKPLVEVPVAPVVPIAPAVTIDAGAPRVAVAEKRDPVVPVKATPKTTKVQPATPPSCPPTLAAFRAKYTDESDDACQGVSACRTLQTRVFAFIKSKAYQPDDTDFCRDVQSLLSRSTVISNQH